MLSSALALALTLLAPQTTVDRPPVHPRRLLVKLRPDALAAEVEAAHRSASARVLRDLPQIGWQIVQVEEGGLLAAREAYAGSAVIERADFDRARKVAYVPNDPMWPGMWHMVRIKADQAWDTHRGDPSVRVAVMDTGIEVTHPDLAANIWVNPGEIPGNSIDDDGNGYVDDINGYDFAYDDPVPDDQHGHGTSCAGIVAAVQDNFIGVTGVAPQCQLVAVKAGLDSGYFYDSANVPALLYCADMGFQAVSMSFYSDGVTPAEMDAVEYCHDHDVVLVAAAGNDSQVLPYYPAAYEEVIAVAATTTSDSKASWSNFGSWVDLAAPGVSIRTTTKNAGYTSSFAGTSAAAPHVAGAIGLLRGAVLGASNDEVRAALEDTGVPLIEYPYGEYTNYGLIDCYAALQRILGNTSGSKPARLLFADPVSGGCAPDLLRAWPVARSHVLIYGVGFEQPNLVRVLRGGQPLALFDQTRNWVDVEADGAFPDLVEIEVEGAVIGSYLEDFAKGFVYTPSDASTQGGGGPVALGGFEELYRDDNVLFTCTRRSDATILVQTIVRKVHATPISSMELDFTRAYVNTSGTETIKLYDWSTASYPYGSWVTISSAPVSSGSMQTLHVDVSQDPLDFLDDAGTILVDIRTSGASSGARIEADSFRLRVR